MKSETIKSWTKELSRISNKKSLISKTKVHSQARKNIEPVYLNIHSLPVKNLLRLIMIAVYSGVRLR